MKKFVCLLLSIMILFSFGQVIFANPDLSSKACDQKSLYKIKVLPTEQLINGLKITSDYKIVYKTDNGIKIPSSLSMSVSLKNTLRQKIVISYPSTKQYDFVLYDKNMLEIYRWSDNRVFGDTATESVLEPNKTKTFAARELLDTRHDLLMLSNAKYFKAEIPGTAAIIIPEYITVRGTIMAPIYPVNGSPIYKLKSEADLTTYNLKGNFDFAPFVGSRVEVYGYLENLVNKNSQPTLNVIKIKELPTIIPNITVLPSDPLVNGLKIDSKCDPIIYSNGTIALNMGVVLKNELRQNIKITYPSTKKYDFVLYDENMLEIYRWSNSKSFNDVVTVINLKPAEIKKFAAKEVFDTKHELFVLSRARYFKAEIPGAAEVVMPPTEITVYGTVEEPIYIHDGPSDYVLRIDSISKSYILAGNFDFASFVGKPVRVTGLVKNFTTDSRTPILNVTSIVELLYQ